MLCFTLLDPCSRKEPRASSLTLFANELRRVVLQEIEKRTKGVIAPTDEPWHSPRLGYSR